MRTDVLEEIDAKGLSYGNGAQVGQFLKREDHLPLISLCQPDKSIMGIHAGWVRKSSKEGNRYEPENVIWLPTNHRAEVKENPSASHYILYSRDHTPGPGSIPLVEVTGPGHGHEAYFAMNDAVSFAFRLFLNLDGQDEVYYIHSPTGSKLFWAVHIAGEPLLVSFPDHARERSGDFFGALRDHLLWVCGFQSRGESAAADERREAAMAKWRVSGPT